jgi:hypothetical protein
MDSTLQRTGRIGGVWFILTFLFSIPTLWFYAPILDHHTYILGAGQDTRVAIGAFFDAMTGLSGIATAVVFYPVLKRKSHSLALGYIATRTVETATIVLGLVSMLAVVRLRHDFSGGNVNAAAAVVASRSLVAVYHGAFLVGPSFCAGIGNGMVLGYLLYRSGLFPKRLAMLGLIGGPLAFVAAALAILGVYDQNSAAQNVLTAPEIAWEAALGIYLAVRGFRPQRGAAIDLSGVPAQAAPRADVQEMERSS